jgi:RNA polymerase sigma-70 factor (ECF subfamily)
LNFFLKNEPFLGGKGSIACTYDYEGTFMDDPLNNNIQQTLQRLWDQSLVIRFQAGDESAFTDIVKEMQEPLRRYVIKVFHVQPADGDDLLQDVWLDACKGLYHLRQPNSLRPWLYRITRNRVLKRLQRQKKTAQLNELTLCDSKSVQSETDSIENEALLTALADLSALQREAVVLRFEQGLNYNEIASTVGCPIGTVRSRLHHARKHLRQTLRRFNHDDSE